jgi:hypothetical protein
VIDYAPIDGRWGFTISKQDIRQGMIFMVQQLVNRLIDRGLLNKDSPMIELENAGWGLEHGIQSAGDYRMLFEQLYDPFDKVRIGWEINHLLHAIGKRPDGSGAFLLPDEEIDGPMRIIEDEHRGNPTDFAQAWIDHNLLDPVVINKTGSLHLSDCALKTTEYFRNGKLREPYYSKINALENWEAQENYGVEIVLKEYDSHLPLGTGILVPGGIQRLISGMAEKNPNLVLLHELKNSRNQEKALKTQFDFLFGPGGNR